MVSTNLTRQIIAEDGRAAASACAESLKLLDGKTILITGATGFVGGSIVDALLAFNTQTGTPCRLLLTTRSVDTAKKMRPDLFGVPGVRWIEWREGSPIADVAAPCEYLIHAAAPTSAAAIAANPFASAQQITALTAQVVEWARRHHVRSMLLLSSGAVYGRPPEKFQTIPESYAGAPDPVAPESAYGEAKRYCELLCSTSGVPFTVARLFACFGPRQALESGFAIPDFFRQLLGNGHIEVAGDGEARRAFGYITDVVAALLKLLLRGDSGPQVCNVGADTPVVSIAELARLVAHIWGGADVLIRGNSGDALRPRYIPDISKMKALHHPQVGLEAGLRRMAESLRAGRTINSAVSRA